MATARTLNPRGWLLGGARGRQAPWSAWQRASGGIVSFTVVVVDGIAGGGYFPRAWRLTSFALLALALAALVGRRRIALGLLERWFLGLVAALTAWTAASTIWSDTPATSVLEAERDVVYLAAVAAVLLALERESLPVLLGGDRTPPRGGPPPRPAPAAAPAHLPRSGRDPRTLALPHRQPGRRAQHRGRARRPRPLQPAALSRAHGCVRPRRGGRGRPRRRRQPAPGAHARHGPLRREPAALLARRLARGDAEPGARLRRRHLRALLAPLPAGGLVRAGCPQPLPRDTRRARPLRPSAPPGRVRPAAPRPARPAGSPRRDRGGRLRRLPRPRGGRLGLGASGGDALRPPVRLLRPRRDAQARRSGGTPPAADSAPRFRTRARRARPDPPQDRLTFTVRLLKKPVKSSIVRWIRRGEVWTAARKNQERGFSNAVAALSRAVAPEGRSEGWRVIG